jgi:fructose-1,6-bisphosphatase/inositol monophosphatase family enzyme
MDRVLDHPEKVLDIMRGVAEAEIMPRFKTLEAHEISEKKPGDLVTVADKESERALTKHLQDLLPESRVIGEEGYEANPETLRMLGEPGPVWIVDPVDGTHNFAHGKSPFTVIVALADGGETLGGWMIDPVAGDAVWARHGGGAWRQDAAGKVSAAGMSLETFETGTMTSGPKLRRRLERAASELGTPLPRLIDRYRCAGREYMDIADGRIHFTRYGGILKPWDHAAGALIVREAGGQADGIVNGDPYRVSNALGTLSIGVVGDARHWQTFRDLVRRADELAGG